LTNDDPIGPETRVGELLRRHPELEETLVGLSPEFERLRNPVLRATVARVATLRQVAQVGRLDVGRMIAALRHAAGLEETEPAPAEAIQGCAATAGPSTPAGGAETGAEGTGITGSTTADPDGIPSWYNAARVVRVFDARPMLARGEHPLSPVVQAAEALEGEGILELVTPFEPAPLIDVVRKRGFDVWTRPAGEGAVRTAFRRRPAPHR